MRVNLNRPLPVRGGFVVVYELAEAMDMHRSNLLKKLKSMGVPLEKRRDHEARGQFVGVIARDDAERFLARLRAESIMPHA
jgi:hypothetical protein